LVGYFLFKKAISKYSNLLNHVSIFSAVWIFLILGSQVTKFVVLEEYTLTIVYISWYFFLLGSYIFTNKINGNKKTIQELSNIKAERNLIRLCFALTLLSFVLNFDILKKVFFDFSSFSDWAQMRDDDAFSEFRDNNFLYTLFGNTSNIYIPISIYLFVTKKISPWTFALIYFVATLLALATFNRAPLLFLLIISLVSYSFITGKVPYKLIFSSTVIMLFLFMLTSYYLNINSNDSESSSNLVFIYIFGGISAYQNLLNDGYIAISSFDSQFYSFDFINYILKTIGIITTYPNLVREYDLKVMTNVYTYLDCFTLDFGILGAFFGSFIIGLISKIFYLKFVNNRSIFYLIIYATFCYYASFIFMNNEYIRFGVILFIIKIYFLIFTFKLINIEFKTN
jgi:oligosaccharide repeat unit polymerase